MKEGVRFILIFVYCFLVQVFVLGNIHGVFWFHPFLYLFFLLYLTPEISKWAFVLIAFATGAVFDIFLNSHGIHASAALFVGLLKPYFSLSYIRAAPAREDEKGSWLNKGKRSFKIVFLTVFILLHHFLVFFMETLGQNFVSVFLPTWLGSSAASFVLTLLSEELFYKTFRTDQ